VLANRTPLVYSKIDRPGNFVFQKNSAGLGVPRQLGNLHGVSNHVERSGFVNRQFYEPPAMPERSMADRGTATAAAQSGSLNSTAHDNHSWSFRDNHQAGMNSQSFHRGPDGQAGGFRGDRGGNASAGSFHQGGGGGSFHGGSSGAQSSGGSFHGGGGGTMGGNGGGGFHGGGGGSMSGGAGGGGGFHGGGGGGGSSAGSSGAAHR
jgi:hypothetical protein